MDADPSLIGPAEIPFNVTEAEAAATAFYQFLGFGPEKVLQILDNIYKAHKQAIEDGMLDWSEANYLRYALG